MKEHLEPGQEEKEKKQGSRGRDDDQEG